MLAVALVCLVASPSLVLQGARRPSAGLPAAASIIMQGGSIEGRAAFKMVIDLGDKGKGQLKFKPLEPSSEAVEVRYKVPFGLNVENQGGRAICTKDGEGGEKVGDILRYTTFFSMQLPGGGGGGGGGVADTLGSFGGLLSWQIGLFDVARAKSWDELVEKLVSNTPERTDEVVLVFERPTEA